MKLMLIAVAFLSLSALGQGTYLGKVKWHNPYINYNARATGERPKHPHNFYPNLGQPTPVRRSHNYPRPSGSIFLYDSYRGGSIYRKAPTSVPGSRLYFNGSRMIYSFPIGR